MCERKHVCMLAHVPKCTLVAPTAGSLTTNKLRELFLPCPWHHATKQCIRSDKRLRDERARMKGIVCHPYSVFIFVWQCLHMVLTLSVLVYMPFQVFMYCPNRFDPFILTMDVMSFFNMLITFVTGYVDVNNKMIVLQPKLIALHYIKTTFLFDLIGMLPLQVMNFYEDCTYPSNTIMLLFKLCRIVTFNKEWKILLQELELTYDKKKLITLIVQVLLFFHWMTYLHCQVPSFAVHQLKDHDEYSWWVNGFINEHNNHDTLLKKYTNHLFVTTGVCIGAGYLTQGDQFLISDLLLTSFIGMAGEVFLVYTVATLLQLAMYKDYDKNLFNGRLMQLREYMSYKRLPKTLRRKIQLFIDYKFNGHYFNENIIMNTINEQVKQDINMYGAKGLVMNVPIFQDMPIALINAIIFRLTQVLYMPGQVLVKYGEPGKSLFLISSGTVTVMNATGREMAHMRDGAFFGMTALLYPGTERSATIIALEITEIYSLDNNSLQTCLQPYPHLKRRIEDIFLKLRMRV